MRIRCYKITFLKDGSLESLESLEVIIPSYNQESAKRNIERHGLRIIIQNTHYGYLASHSHNRRSRCLMAE